MRRMATWWSLLLITFAAPAWAGTTASIDIHIGDAPPPPTVVFRREPAMVVVPNTSVYVMSLQDDRIDYDYFHYGVYWYIFRDGWWYRGRRYRGPFNVVAVKYVPHAIIDVPARHWRHHPHGGPPGLVRREAAVRHERRADARRERRRH